MLVIVVLLLLLAALIYPYASVFFARLRMLRQLLVVARTNGYRVDGSLPGMLMARNRSDRYELLLVREDAVIAVKLWSATHRSDSLVLTDHGRVVLCRSGRTPIETGKSRSSLRRTSHPHAVPRTRLPKSYAERHDVVRVLLVYPSYREIVLMGKDRRLLRSGDAIFDKQLHSPSSLKQLICGGENETLRNEEKEAQGEKKEKKTLDKSGQNTKI